MTLEERAKQRAEAYHKGRAEYLTRLEANKEKVKGWSNVPGHAHDYPGIWDSDNGDKAGTICEQCFRWNDYARLVKAHSDMVEALGEIEETYRHDFRFYCQDHAEGLEHIQKQGATYTFADGAMWGYKECLTKLKALMEVSNDQEQS